MNFLTCIALLCVALAFMRLLALAFGTCKIGNPMPAVIAMAHQCDWDEHTALEQYLKAVLEVSQASNCSIYSAHKYVQKLWS